MKAVRIWTMGIILVMLFMGISIVYSQDDQALTDAMLQKRDRLTAEMNAEIGVMKAFDKGTATTVCSVNQCVFTGNDGRVLREEYDSAGNLIVGTFTDPINNMELVINYTTNGGIICMSLQNNMEEDKLRLCNPCPLRNPGILQIQQAGGSESERDWSSGGAFQHQTCWDFRNGYILKLTVSCCGVIQGKPIFERGCPHTHMSEVD